MFKFHALILAAGSGSRFGGNLPKQYTQIAKKAIIDYSLEVLLANPDIASVNIAVAKDDPHSHLIGASIDSKLKKKMKIYNCGGKTRAETALNLLKKIKAKATDFAVIHDAARALLHPTDLNAILKKVQKSNKPSILASEVIDTVKTVNAKLQITSTLDRKIIYLAQTPQVVPIADIKKAYRNNLAFIDEAQALENIGITCQIVVSRYPNLKLTTKKDLAIFRKLL